MTHYIRVDAVNIYATVGDTEDLSTRRGLGLALLMAIDELPAQLKQLGLGVISTGASSGFFSVATDPFIACRAITTFLQTHELYQHGTFVVTHVQDVKEDAFVSNTERCIAQNRWQQMQSLSLPLSALQTGQNLCKITQKQAGTLQPPRNNQPPEVCSPSIVTRRSEGINLRQGFYERWGSKNQSEPDQFIQSLNFTNDFEKLSGEWIGSPNNLDHKIALFYADGNDFGKRQAMCKSIDALNRFDQLIKDSRRSFLHALLDKINSDAIWKTSNGALRLETLLWGGDELMLVVPAWKGLELAKLFFEKTDDLQWMDAPKDETNPDEHIKLKKLTHSCGLVFAHHNAPISRLQQLVLGLADEGKSASRDTNSLTWCVLESFDHIGSDRSGFLQRRYPQAPDMIWSELSLSAHLLTELLTCLTTELKAALPRSDISRIVRIMSTQTNAFVNGSSALALLKRSYDNVKSASHEAKKLETWVALWNALNNAAVETVFDPANPKLQDLSAWVKLLELWDYTNPSLNAQDK